MLIALIGGVADGTTFEIVTGSPQPILRLPVFRGPAYWGDDPGPENTGVDFVQYELALTVPDHRLYYVEEGVLARWRDIEYIVP